MRPSLPTAVLAAALIAVSAAAPGPVLAQSGNPLSSIFSCQASGGKQAGGAVIGGVVGGLLGNRVAGRGDRTLGTVLGAAVGAAAGSYIGCRMQTGDQQRAEAATRAALESNRSGSWSNPATGASGDVRLISTSGGAAPVSLNGLRMAAGVEPVAAYEAAGGQLQARMTANLRGSPSAGAPLTGTLAVGDVVDALAKVRGANWYLAGRNGMAIGYVAGTAVTPFGAAAPPPPTCRTFDQVIRTADGASDTQRYTACKSAAGDWVVQT